MYFSDKLGYWIHSPSEYQVVRVERSDGCVVETYPEEGAFVIRGNKCCVMQLTVLTHNGQEWFDSTPILSEDGMEEIKLLQSRAQRIIEILGRQKK